MQALPLFRRTTFTAFLLIWTIVLHLDGMRRTVPSLSTLGNDGEVVVVPPTETTASAVSSSPSSPPLLKTKNESQWIDHATMKRLIHHMREVKTGRKREPQEMLRFLISNQGAQARFPLLGSVPITGIIDPSFEFKGSENEDKEIFLRFFNAHTQTCHTFNQGGLFESGAFRGFTMSNTYFFEKQFGLPTTLVEASKENWVQLDRNVAAHRPLSTVHRAALCPMGDEYVCPSNGKAPNMDSVDRVASCEERVPCFDFDESRRYALVSLDIEGFEWEFLKLRNLKADLLVVEVIQWLRDASILTAVELMARMADLGYYLYASPDNMVGKRNFLFVSQGLAEHCFAKEIIRPLV